MKKEILEDFITSQKNKVVESIDIDNSSIKYSSSIQSSRDINKITGEEELVRAVFLTKLVNQYGYKPERIELEKEYDMGRPKVIYPRIDVIVKDEKGDAYMFIELKAPDKFEEDQDQVIEQQLFNLAGAELALNHKIKYLVLLSCDLDSESLTDKAIVIDYDKYKSFDDWKSDRYYADEIPARYGKAIKTPYIKGSKKDLNKNYSSAQIESIRENLHNVLWGGGGTDDNEVFSSLVNIILAKIQDESEKNDGETYDFQSLAYEKSSGEVFETNEELFERINQLYRRALHERMYISKDIINKSYIINEEKFSLSKLKYAVMALEKYSLVDGKNSFDGKDILGDFFEGIIRDGFKQSKGQFFTHINVVNFILWGLQLDKLAVNRINKDKEIPYLIDPSAGSATFLIEYMRFITKNIKYRFRDKILRTRDLDDKLNDWFYPDHRENKWAKTYIYGIEHNFNLGTASKVNMILHGDGSTNIFVKDGLLPFCEYTKTTAPNALNICTADKNYHKKNINGQFDVVVSNPPFSVDLDNDTKSILPQSFIFSDKRNSENLFVERYYHLLKDGGRMGIVLPESVFDTTENKYIRLFIYKYFDIKAIVSLPTVTFAPYTNTKTSIIFAQKKRADDVERWTKTWNDRSSRYRELASRCSNLLKVVCQGANRNSYKNIKNNSEEDDKALVVELLKSLMEEQDIALSSKELVVKYQDEIKMVCKPDKDLKNYIGVANYWWVFGEVASELSYEIMMIEADNVGYKRTKRGVKEQPNDLFRTKDGEILVDDGIKETALDYLRTIQWK